MQIEKECLQWTQPCGRRAKGVIKTDVALVWLLPVVHLVHHSLVSPGNTSVCISMFSKKYCVLSS